MDYIDGLLKFVNVRKDGVLLKKQRHYRADNFQEKNTMCGILRYLYVIYLRRMW